MSRINFNDLNPDASDRYRYIDRQEISEGKKFLSVEMDYSGQNKENINFKKLVGFDAGLDSSVYSEAIRGIDINDYYYSEKSSLEYLDPDEDFLARNTFLIRPSTRYENEAHLIMKQDSA